MSHINLKEYLLGTKKMILLILTCYLLIIIPLWNSFSSNSQISQFLILTILLTALVVMGFYWSYTQYNRIKEKLEKKGIVKFLTDHGFKINERSNGWNYIIGFSGIYKKSFIIIGLDFKKGNFWNRYSLSFQGIPLTQYKKLLSKELLSVQPKFYPETIQINRNKVVLIQLEEHIDKLNLAINE